MRAWMFLALAAGCSPVIATGDYLCGIEEACPAGQVCNGADNTCVLPSTATAFACDPAVETHEPDEDVAHASPLGTLDCVSQPIEIAGCLAANDSDDWYAFSTRPECTTEALAAQIAAPIAFEGVTIELYDATGATKLATGQGNCSSVQPADESGEANLCISQMLTPGTSYALRVTPTLVGNCKGNCMFNRYRLNLQTAVHPE